jgi:hypothetical protein
MSFFGWLTGADKAAKATKKAYNAAEALTREGQQKATDLLLPGANYQPAQSKIMALLGLEGGQAQEDAYGSYRESPGVAFQRQQGEQAALRAASASGSLGGTRTQKNLSQFNQGLAEQGFGDWYSRLREMYDSQKGTAGQVAGGYTSGASRLSDLALGRGQAKAQLATQNSPWSVIGGLTGIAADAAAMYMGMPPKPKSGSSVYAPSATFGGPK